MPPQLRTYQIYNNNKISPVGVGDIVEIESARKTSKWYWCMNKVNLKSEYERVRLKMYNINKMHKNCKKMLKKLNKKRVLPNRVYDSEEEEEEEEEELLDTEETEISRRCMPTTNKKAASIGYFKDNLIKFNLLKPYTNFIEYLLSTSYNMRMQDT